MVLVLLLVCFSNRIFSQDSLICHTQNNIRKSNLICTAAIASAVYAGGWLYINNNWYSKDSHVPFFFTNDLSGYLQVDKFQHAFGAYYESYVTYKVLLNSGISRKNTLLWTAFMGLIIQSPKELIDGHTKDDGFSWGDILADFSGSALFTAQELAFKEQIFRYKFSFSRSVYEDQAHGYLGNNLIQSYFKDYNGHTYWLSMNADRLVLKNKIPDWINIAFGYSANGMLGKLVNPERYNGYQMPKTDRYRQYLLSFDIDWTKIKTRSKFLKKIFNGMVFIKIPFPALELNSKGQFKGYWLYF